ncbi:hypothetical protein ID866_11130, partial [Astraeus odoratus]
MMDSEFDAATLLREELDHYQPGDPKRSTMLLDFAFALYDRFKDNNILSDLNEAIDAMREAVRICPPEHPKHSVALQRLAAFLHSRYDSRDSAADLEEAISLDRDALKLCKPGHPDRLLSLITLGCVLGKKFMLDGDVEALEQAIACNQEALMLHKPGQPNRGIALYNLARHLVEKFRLDGGVEALEQAITYNREALELHKSQAGGLDRGVILNNLGRTLLEKFNLDGDTEVLEEAIRFLREALELYHEDRPLPLSNLAAALRCRYDVKGSMVDLEEVIALRRENVELHPSGHCDRAKHLGYLASNLETKFRAADTMEDLEEAISLYRKALDLCPPGHPDRMTYINKVSSCLRARAMRQPIIQIGQPVNDNYPSDVDPQPLEVHDDHEQESGPSIDTPNPQTTDSMTEETRRSIPSHVMEIIKDVIYDTLTTMPPRLLDTHTGKICDKTVHISRVESSLKYQELLVSIASYDNTQDTKHIRAMVSTCFQCNFATLSHRWGRDEPILADVRERSIYDSNMLETEGLRKLRMFCRTAAKNGYPWGWSDTCCINKTNSVELQQAIGTMFLWYRMSAMTIVHLGDIPGAAPAGALVSSVWFKRGWTLQELL